MSPLRFRNVEVDTDIPVEEWSTEAIHAALERGTIVDWRPLARAIVADPWGTLARRVEEVLSFERPYGTAELMERTIAWARDEAERSERDAVAAEIRGLVERSGLSRSDFASRIGTSASRLSTYCSGRVLPSAGLVERMRRMAPHRPSCSIPASGPLDEP